MTFRNEIVSAVVAWRDARRAGDKHRTRNTLNALLALFEQYETKWNATAARGRADTVAGAVLQVGRARRRSCAAATALGSFVGSDEATGFVVSLDNFAAARDHEMACWDALYTRAQGLRPIPPARRAARLAA